MKTDTKIDADYVESVLHRYGFEKIKKTRNGFSALCKFHDNRNTPAFSIGNNGLWHCFSCEAKGNIKQLHERLGGDVGWQEELKILGVQLNPRKYDASQVKKKIGAMPRDFKPYGMHNKPPGYVLGRLKWPTVSYFGLGSSNEGRCRDRVIIPVKFKGKNVGFHGRAISDKEEMKYYNSSGFEIKDYLFNYDSCEKGEPLIVVEGAFNAMSMWEKGFPNTVATFGTKFTNKQVQLMFSLAPESIVICFDRDSHKDRPGQKAAIALAEVTYQLIPTYIMPLPIDLDPNALSAETLMACYQKRVAYEKLRGQ